MKTTKRIITTILVVLLIVTSAPLAGIVGLESAKLGISASAAENLSGTCADNLKWNFDASSGLLTLSCEGYMKDYYDCEYDDATPWENLPVESVKIEEGLNGIGRFAFRHCKKLKSILIPDSVKFIDDAAFADCISLTRITIPDSVTSIGNDAFSACTSLETVTIGKGVNNIGENVFFDCNSLKSITVDSKNKDYSSDTYGVLYNKKKTMLMQYPVGNTRTSFSIPDSVTAIGVYAFRNCKRLNNIIFPESVTYISNHAFYACTGLTSVTIDGWVRTIGIHSFDNCTKLTTVTIGKYVSAIGEMAFNNCTALKSIVVDPKNESYSSDINGALYNKDKTKIIRYPIGNTQTSFSIPNSVKNIDKYAFNGCANIKCVTIGAGVTNIGNMAFSDCTNLTDIIILADNIKYINNVFKNSKISNVYIYSRNFEFSNKLIPADATIYAFKGSKAEECANQNGYLFKPLENIHTTHSHGSWKTTKAATCKAEGIKERVCSLCGQKETSSIKKLTTHKYTNITTKATLTKNGKITPTCSVCKATKTATTIYYPKTFTIAIQTYTGKALKPNVTIKDSNGKVIANTNYTVSYSNNTAIGTAKAKVIFKGNYSGSKSIKFKIVPAQVTGLKASSVATTSLKLSWTKVNGAKYYKVEQSADGKTWKVLTTTDKTTYTVSNLTAGSKHQFRVTALDSTKKIAGKASAVLKTQTLCSAPAITLTSTKSKTATVSWKKVTGASKYVVYKSTDGKNWTKVATTTAASYNITKLTGGKRIYVKVQATNAYGLNSAFSAAKNVTVKK